MTKDYEVTGENTVDKIVEVFTAPSKKEALRQARKWARSRVIFSRYDGPVRWTVGEVE